MRKRSGYRVEMERAPVKEVELEVKEVTTEKVDNEKTTIFQFKFTTGNRFDVSAQTGSYDCEIYWKRFKEGDKVIANVRAQNIISIYLK